MDEALIFVHGFDTSFDDALYREAQIVWDMRFAGLPVLFSWASKGSLLDYFYDQQSAEAVGRPSITGGRKANSAYRQREHLTEAEIVRLMETARDNRYGARDAALVFVMFRHGLRVSEACALNWSAIDFAQKELHVRRSKLGKPATHPIRGDELRALRRLHRDAGAPRHGPVFVSERDAAFTRDGINKLIARAGEIAGFGYRVHPHMLRHARGFALAKAGHDTRRLQDYLGHKSISSTVRYTELDSGKFADFWR